MLTKKMVRRTFGWSAGTCALTALVFASAVATESARAGSVLYSNGFETDTAGWTAATQVAGTSGLPAASGSSYATATTTGDTFTRWGGYNYGAGGGVPTAFQEYTTSVDIYLDVGGGRGERHAI